jgi:hypothetical protein
MSIVLRSAWCVKLRLIIKYSCTVYKHTGLNIYEEWNRQDSNTYLLIYSMQHSPSWEANWFAASQKIPWILWNPKVHYHIHKFPPSVSILSQPNPVHTPHATSWRSILILSFHLRLGLPSGLFPSGFPTSPPPIRAQCHTHLIILVRQQLNYKMEAQTAWWVNFIKE